MPSLMTRLRRALAPAREQKTSRAGQLLALQAFGQPHWTSRNESALAREGYERNAICHRCVRMSVATMKVPTLFGSCPNFSTKSSVRTLSSCMGWIMN